jgi:hypothetical protein
MNTPVLKGCEMEISPEVELIIEFLSTSTGDGLQDERLFSQFLQHAQSAGKQEALGKLAFHGKYLRNLYIAIRRQTQESELYEKMEKEFSRATNDFHGMVTEFIADGEEEFRAAVERHALAVSENGLRNLLSLAEDFTALKNLELEMMQRRDENEDGEDAAGEDWEEEEER